MRKWMIFMLAFFLYTNVFSTVNAKPAPNLSKIQITHVGADSTGWVSSGKASAITLYGKRFYVAVQFTGYPDPSRVFLYQNGVLIPKSEISEPFGRLGIGNPHTGWVYQFALPIAYGNGIIAVEADGINGGRQYSTIFGVKSMYQP